MDAANMSNCAASNTESINKYDIKFVTFYYEAIRKLVDIENKTNASSLSRYFKIFEQYFIQFFRENPNVELDYSTLTSLKDSLYYGVIYVFKCSSFLSSAVAFQFQNCLKDNPDYLQRLLKKQSLKICSLGGGPASDIVAIITVLESLAQKEGITLDFQVTVIDLDANWKNTCITVLSCLEQFQNATWKINFIEEDLSNWKSYSSKTTDAIQEADIVSMVMFLSDLKDKNRIRDKTLKHISETLQPQAMLFLLDESRINLIKSMGGCSGEINGLQLAYEELCDYHTLDINAVRTFSIQYEKTLGTFKSNFSWDIFTRIWIKHLSRSSENSTNELKQRFEIKYEKYNPKRDFLNITSFKSWEKIFSQQKEREGWHQKGIKKVIQEQNEMRNQFIARLVKETKLLNGAQELLRESQLFNDTENLNSNERNEEAWMEYLKRKKDFSLLKREIYKFSKMLTYKVKK